MGNPALRWQARFSAPAVGRFNLPFETHAQAQACVEHVRANGVLPLMHNGNVIQTRAPESVCRLCGQRGVGNPCADCLNDQQAT